MSDTRRGTCRRCDAPVHERYEGRSGARRFGSTSAAHMPGHAPADGHLPDPVWDERPAAPLAHLLTRHGVRTQVDLVSNWQLDPGHRSALLASAERRTRRDGVGPGWYVTRRGATEPEAGPIRLKATPAKRCWAYQSMPRRSLPLSPTSHRRRTDVRRCHHPSGVLRP